MAIDSQSYFFFISTSLEPLKIRTRVGIAKAQMTQTAQSACSCTSHKLMHSFLHFTNVNLTNCYRLGTRHSAKF